MNIIFIYLYDRIDIEIYEYTIVNFEKREN